MADNCSSSNGGMKGLRSHLESDKSQHRDRTAQTTANPGTGSTFRGPRGQVNAHEDMSFEDFVESNGLATARPAPGSTFMARDRAGSAPGHQQPVSRNYLNVPFDQAWAMYCDATSRAAALVRNRPAPVTSTNMSGPKAGLMRGPAGQNIGPMRAATGPFPVTNIGRGPFMGLPSNSELAPQLPEQGRAYHRAMVHGRPNPENMAANNATTATVAEKMADRWTAEQWEAAYILAESKYNDDTEFADAQDTWMAAQRKLEKRPAAGDKASDALGKVSDARSAAEIQADIDRIVAGESARSAESSGSPSTVVAYNDHGHTIPRGPQEQAKEDEEQGTKDPSDIAKVAADIVGTMSTTTNSKFKESKFMRLMQGVANHEIIVKGDNFMERETRRPVASIVYQRPAKNMNATVADAEDNDKM